MPLRLMIVDDSTVARTVLSRMISGTGEFEIVALAADAAEAMEAIRTTKVDVVLLDVEMPGTSGLDILPEIIARGEGAQILVVSSNCDDGAEATVRALALGAADTLPKPGTGAFAGKFAEVLADKLRKIGRAVRERGNSATSTQAGARLRPFAKERLECLALGASTGGLHALMEFFVSLPERIDVPILITQHLPAVFIPSFARQIGLASGRPTRVAEERILLARGEIIVAPGDHHLGLRRFGNQVRVALADAPASSGCMPSVDTMLASLAEIFGPAGLGVVFSGMGRDGLEGSRALVDRGGSVIVQDEQTSAVWGMPRAVASAGLASAILPPRELAACIASNALCGAWK